MKHALALLIILLPGMANAHSVAYLCKSDVLPNQIENSKDCHLYDPEKDKNPDFNKWHFNFLIDNMSKTNISSPPSAETSKDIYTVYFYDKNDITLKLSDGIYCVGYRPYRAVAATEETNCGIEAIKVEIKHTRKCK